MINKQGSNLFRISISLVIILLITISCSGNNSEDKKPQETGDKKKESLTRRIAEPEIAYDEKRKVALIIGNSEYRGSANIPELINPRNDAEAMARVLEGLGFEVILALDLSKDRTLAAIESFRQKIHGSSATFFFYAGHGVQYKGHNYMVPVTAVLERYDHIERHGVNFKEIFDVLDEAATGTNILIFDACRNLPRLEKTRSLETREIGLARLDAPVNSIVGYSTSAGKVANDGDGKNSPYTEELLRWIRAPGIPIQNIFMLVRKDVMRKTDNEQMPQEFTALTDDFYFIQPNDDIKPSIEIDSFERAAHLFNEGLELSRSKKYDEAINLFTRVTEISPTYAEAYHERGKIYLIRKNINRALDDLGRAIELNPDYAAAYNNRGIAYSMLHEVDTAMNNFDRALEVDRGFLKTYNNKAFLYQREGFTNKALDVYAQAIALDPTYAPVYNNRGVLYSSIGEYEKAIEDYSTAIEFDTYYTKAYHNRAISNYYLGNNEESLEDYNRAIVLEPDNHQFYTDRSHLYEEMGMSNRAEQDRRKANELRETH